MTANLHIDSSLVVATEQYVRQLLTENLPVGYQYHSLEHTEQVVLAAQEIGRQQQVATEELHLLTVAGWLHDIGYIDRYVGHEDASIEMARAFLQSQHTSEGLIERVIALIDATRLEVEPRNLLEEIIKDADLYNLSTAEALENSAMIRSEWKIFCGREFTDEEWDRFNHRFFKNHSYYTTYARDALGPSKKQNTKQLKKRVKQWDALREQPKSETKPQLNGESPFPANQYAQQRILTEIQLEQQEAEIDKLKRRLKKLKRQRPDRGIETMFRTTYRTHINLSDLADNKANILLSINAIIISIVFTGAFSNNLEFYMFVPGFLLLAVCMATIVFAILATRPKVNSGIFDREDILNKKTNLLFFGNFHRMDLDDFQWGINQMMNDADYLYGSMAKDIYFLGKVLARKFALLRYAYNVFMFGIGAVLLVFFIAFVVWGRGN